MICIISFSLKIFLFFFFFFLQGKSAGDESPQSMCLRKSLFLSYFSRVASLDIELKVIMFSF